MRPISAAAALLAALALVTPAAAAPPAAGERVTVTSRHGFALDVPKGWVVEPFLDECTLGVGLEGAGVLHLYNYDYQSVEHPGEPVPPDKIKIEALVCLPAHRSAAAWARTLPAVASTAPFATGAGEALRVVNTECDMESGGTFTLDRVLIVTPTLQADFHYFPPGSALKAEFERIVASFRPVK